MAVFEKIKQNSKSTKNVLFQSYIFEKIVFWASLHAQKFDFLNTFHFFIKKNGFSFCTSALIIGGFWKNQAKNKINLKRAFPKLHFRKNRFFRLRRTNQNSIFFKTRVFGHIPYWNSFQKHLLREILRLWKPHFWSTQWLPNASIFGPDENFLSIFWNLLERTHH